MNGSKASATNTYFYARHWPAELLLRGGYISMLSLRSAVRWEARAARQVAETLKDIRQRGRGRGSAFLPSRIIYTANGNSTFQLHRVINAGDVQLNPGPRNVRSNHGCMLNV